MLCFSGKQKHYTKQHKCLQIRMKAGWKGQHKIGGIGRSKTIHLVGNFKIIFYSECKGCL